MKIIKKLFYIILILAFTNELNYSQTYLTYRSHTYGGVNNRQPFGSQNICHWTYNPNFLINEDVEDDDGITFAEALTEVNRALSTWTNVTTANVSPTVSSTGTSSTWGWDGNNTIYWATAGSSAYGTDAPLEGAGSPYFNPGAVTMVVCNADGEIEETDIIFNSDDAIKAPWIVNTDPSVYYTTEITGILTHELGHCLGLGDLGGHLPYTMSTYCSEDPRDLTDVDRFGISFIYGGNIIDDRTLTNANNYFDWDVNLASGTTLTIDAGTTLNFTNGTSITVDSYGILIADGNSSEPITFDFVSPNSSTQNGIKFTRGSFGTINYCQIRNAYRGIYEYYGTTNINNSAISGCTNGIYLYSSSPTIQWCNIHNNSYGINLVYSSPTIKENYIQNNATGIYCSSSSQPVIGNNSTQEGNHIGDNGYGVIVFNNAIPVLGNTSSGGYNNLVNPNNNVLNTTVNTIYAYNNWWGTTDPSSFLISGTVLYTPYLTSAVTIGTPPLSKTGGDVYAAESSEIPMLSELDKAYELVASNNLVEAREVCLNLVKNYPDYSVAYNALNLLKETYPEKELTANKDMHKSLFNQRSKKDLYAMAGLILADIDKENKLEHIDEVINNYKGESVVELALFNKFVYYYFEEEDKEKARAISEELDSQFELSRGAVEAHQILGDEEYYEIEVTEKQARKDTVNRSSEEYEYSLFENYPNPFNPTTRIKFSISEACNVTLKIYNTLGEEVKVLVNETLQPGKYEKVFDASHLASGIYFYKITAGKYREVKKMLLVK
ncbi:MAG: T9SS type A sorting domain-containing protein [Ignavibacteria bacterium]|jgi:parallel beta-helix repeat protein